jgi:hypothetical protein
VPRDLMMFIRAKKKDERIYYYIVEAIRKKDKVQQKVLCYLGTAESLLKKMKSLKKKI